MKNVSTLLLLIIFAGGVLSPKYGFYQHALANEIAYQAGYIRGEGPFSNVAVSIIQATNRSPYLLPSKMVQSDNSAIIQLAKKITEGKKTDEEKSTAIYDWMTHHITYDSQEYQNELAKTQFTYKTALETLNDRKGICVDYSNLNAALHRAVGIEAKIVYGEGHAWNQVNLNSVWIDQDTTYGSGYTDNTTHLFIQQFNESYFSYTNKRWEGEFEW